MVRKYYVTMTPLIRSYAGNWSSRQETFDVYAQSAREAIKYARRAYRAEEGRLAPKATFTAKLAESQND